MKQLLSWKFVVLIAAASAVTGCAGAYGRRVPDSLVSKLPFETRIELLEAENDLGVAIDKRDEAQNEVLRARDGLRRAKARLSAAHDEVGRAKDDLSKEVATLAVAEAEARVDYLRAQQEVNVRRADLEELALRCAQARYELARLTAARKAKVEGAEGLSQEDFENQVKACEGDLKDRRAELKEQQQSKAEQAKVVWEKQKTALAKKTFDARASPYVE